MATRLELETQLRAHWPRLRRFAFTLSRDPADADDLVQDSALTSAVILGGPGGRLYVGPNFSQAMPVFLDRLPVATAACPNREPRTQPRTCEP